MYCKKLMNIIENQEGKQRGLSSLHVKKLHTFLLEKCTNRELKNISPLRFAMVMETSESDAINLFAIGCDENLFKVKLYYQCECCTEYIEIVSLNQYVRCENEKDHLPENNPENVHLYFELQEKIEHCNLDTNENNPSSNKKSHLDIFGAERLGKSQLPTEEVRPTYSLMDFQNQLGEDRAHDLINHKRKQIFNEYLNLGVEGV